MDAAAVLAAGWAWQAAGLLPGDPGDRADQDDDQQQHGGAGGEGDGGRAAVCAGVGHGAAPFSCSRRWRARCPRRPSRCRPG